MVKGNVFTHSVELSTTGAVSISLSTVVGTDVNLIQQLTVQMKSDNAASMAIGDSNVAVDGRGVTLAAGKDYTLVNAHHKDIYLVGTVSDVANIIGVI